MNYLWGGLILISIVFAIGSDLHDLYADTYENDRVYQLQLSDAQSQMRNGESIELVLTGSDTSLSGQYKTDNKRSQLVILYSDSLPALWQARFAGDKDKTLALSITQAENGSFKATLPSIVWPRLEKMMQAAFDMADFAAKLAIGLIGLMALWLGLMQIAEESGLVSKLVKVVRPVLKPLFPEVPPDHPAMGAISLNLAANMLGLGNAATPLGIKAMQHLQELNDHRESASNSMCMFLALNTSSVQLLPPVTVIALLGVGAGGLFVSIFLATLCSTIVAIIAARWYAARSVAT
ncbi:MAG: nucleoside recognition protein [Gammaproteobacteria bacterium]|nr:nucleoside recognition protein [Gammaproteobacteria bacterium]